MRPIENASRTGYFIQKLVPHTCNEVDKDYDWGAAFHCYLPYMRLADIYLMYAEAVSYTHLRLQQYKINGRIMHGKVCFL